MLSVDHVTGSLTVMSPVMRVEGEVAQRQVVADEVPVKVPPVPMVIEVILVNDQVPLLPVLSMTSGRHDDVPAGRFDEPAVAAGWGEVHRAAQRGRPVETPDGVTGKAAVGSVQGEGEVVGRCKEGLAAAGRDGAVSLPRRCCSPWRRSRRPR